MSDDNEILHCSYRPIIPYVDMHDNIDEIIHAIKLCKFISWKQLYTIYQINEIWYKFFFNFNFILQIFCILHQPLNISSLSFVKD